MADLSLLGTAEAAARLSTVPQTARGFLGLDPVTQNAALLARELTRTGAQVLSADGVLLGYAPNSVQPRQGWVATTSADPAPLAALLDFLRTYRRCTSYVAEVPEGAPAVAALEACGFTGAGRLPGHVFHSGGYHDVLVYSATQEG
ncbi:GNAT family N-acetyltransferase [Actinacidiphila alni]|uniref:GNAT family N-acetyltransferase n=1 Tax=Actinacidiphila alni TaxID=380248 RepID=UPI0034540AC3